MSKKQKPSRSRPASTLTPSGQPLPDLGQYVVARPRADGTFRVLFEVPARLRPSGWPSTRPLPTNDRRGDLDDLAEVERIRQDAARLYAELIHQRNGREPAPDPDARTLHVLIADLKRTQGWKDNKPRTIKGYEYYLKRIEAWADTGRPDPATITETDVETFLAIWDDRPTDRYHIRKMLRMVMHQAKRRKWRADNPVDDVIAPMPKTRVAIWEQADVDIYVDASLKAARPDIAAIILTEWEIGQRLTDVILFRRKAEYRPAAGMFCFDQSKTAEPVTIPVSVRLRRILARIKRKSSPYLFHDAGTGRPFRDVDRLSHQFEDIRAKYVIDREGKVLAKGGRHLVLRALRHSCVVQLARVGCTAIEIAAITGHSLSSVETILSVYLPRDSTVAANAQRKRGLIA